MTSLPTASATNRRATTSPRSNSLIRPLRVNRAGFSITELLVVIGIIVLLIGILLPALGAAQQRGRQTQTTATMSGFAQACEAYRAQFNTYPGVVPERVLANDPQISGTENALLALLGGYARREDFANTPAGETEFNAFGGDLVTFAGPDGPYRIRVQRFEIGTGPIVGGTQYAPFFSPRPAELAATPGQFFTDFGNPDADRFANDPLELPDLLDGWGQPIIYMRAIRSRGDLVGDSSAADNLIQFDRRTMNPYLVSRGLGERNIDQTNSIINPGFASSALLNQTVAQAIRHPGFGQAAEPLGGTRRGEFVLFSAGRDGVFFSRFDGPGTPNDPITDLEADIITPGALAFDEFDDIRVFGGG